MIETKLFLWLYFLIYFGIVLGLRSFILYKNTGINPFKNLGKSDVVGFNEKVLSFSTILIPFIIFNYLYFPENYQYLIPIQYLETELIRSIGMSFGFIGFMLVFIAQIQMQDSWRIGLDTQNLTKLVDHGLFKYSRNPIYLGLLISFIGFFMVVPNAVSLCFLALMYSSLQIKIRLEEVHLASQNRKEFSAYRQKVRRWL